MKEDVQPLPGPGPVERDDVQSRLNRCPYCHDGVAPAESVVCRQCLTRHHASCHAEAGTCQSCGSSDVLTQTAASAEEQEPGTEPAEEQELGTEPVEEEQPSSGPSGSEVLAVVLILLLVVVSAPFVVGLAMKVLLNLVNQF